MDKGVKDLCPLAKASLNFYSSVMAIVLSSQEMKEIEEKVISGDGPNELELIKVVGRKVFESIRFHFKSFKQARVYVGKGHNGADALALASYLRKEGWSVEIQCSFSEIHWKEHNKKLYRDYLSLSQGDGVVDQRINDDYPVLIIDGLLGLGSSREIQGDLLKSVEEINSLRKTCDAVTVSIDFPSGLGPWSNERNTVLADWTFSIAHPKRSLVEDNSTKFVGRIENLEIPELTVMSHDPIADHLVDHLVEQKLVTKLLPYRHFDWHKGQSGRVLIVAGSKKYPGTARLATEGALRSGVGYCYLHCENEIFCSELNLLPEVIPILENDLNVEFLKKIDAVVIGPGLSPEFCQKFIQKYSEFAKLSWLLDAEACQFWDVLSSKNLNLLLTPHPGELNRIFQKESRQRKEWALDFAKNLAPTSALLLKGARSIAVAGKSERVIYNSTGHPGMAVGGMGDLQAGMMGAYLAQKLTALDSAILGAFNLGRAAELAASDILNRSAVLPSDLAAYL